MNKLSEQELSQVVGGFWQIAAGWLAYEAYANSDQIIGGFGRGYKDGKGH
ncbi:bacteriocin [Leuconostoc mesenteroides]|nr:bacteriocin [Leuconostoc mesenteroides]MCT8384938.1 bacteriocin [Leuconostoc mesenteroides]